MDVIQKLRDAEYALKDHVDRVLGDAIGPDWLTKNGLVGEECLARWSRRRDEAVLSGDSPDPNLIAYCDLSDLAHILRRHWDGSFSEVFGDLSAMEVYLRVLERYRDRGKRELWVYERCLIVGISGEILAKIAAWRNRREAAADYFPNIDEVLDNMGNRWRHGMGKMIFTKTLLKPGDDLELSVKVFDPESWTVQYGIKPDGALEISWGNSNHLFYRISEGDVKQPFFVTLLIRSSRNYHAMGSFDDFVNLGYAVVPQKR